MKTFLAQNQFISNSTAISPRAVGSTADSAYRLQNVARPDATAERDPQPNSVSDAEPLPVSLTSGTAAAFPPLPACDATAAPSSAAFVAAEAAVSEPLVAPSETAATIAIRAAAASDADCISEIFFYARKLMKQPPRFLLDEAAFMAEVEEVPLFLREDGYLQRREA